jgi:hypothetical protein
MAIVKNLTIDQGSTFSVKITITGSDNEVYDLTGYGVPTAQIRKNAESSTITQAMTCMIPEPTLGYVIMTLTDEQSVTIKAGRYMYDMVIESSFGEKYRAVEGIVTVSAGVTR